ncbi:iron ABC transporter permease [soil metagenome]
MRTDRQRAWLVGLAVVVIAVGLASLLVGSSRIAISTLWSTGAEGTLARDIVWGLRLPRTLAAASVGALLALSGTLLQVLLRNPIADPYVLGVSGGASVGALAVLLVVGTTIWIEPAAMIGAVVTTTIVFTLARHDRTRAQSRLLLTGVAVASFCGAIVALLLSLAPDGILRGMIFWLLGDLSGSSWTVAFVGVLVAVPLGWLFGRELDLLSFGDERAASLGVSVARVRLGIFVAAAVMTAIAVTTAGMIGFVGLIVPHAMRLLVGPSHRVLMPAAALGGAGTLMLADVISRIVIAPAQLPVGVVTALVGAPLFVWLLSRTQPGAR